MFRVTIPTYKFPYRKCQGIMQTRGEAELLAYFNGDSAQIDEIDENLRFILHCGTQAARQLEYHKTADKNICKYIEACNSEDEITKILCNARRKGERA